MSLPNYQIVILDPTSGAVITVLDQTVPYQLKYSRAYNGIGALAMTVPLSVVTSAMFNRTDLIIEVQRTSPVTGLLITEETYMAREFRRYREGADERYTYGAVSLNHLLTRRVINPADDPLSAGSGYSTKAGAADSVLYQYASEQCGVAASAQRQFPRFSISGVYGVAPNVGARLSFDNLYEVFVNLAKQAGIDFKISRVSGADLRLDIGYLTTNRTQSANYPLSPFVLLNPQRGNLTSPSLTRDRKAEANHIYMRSKGQGSSRYQLEVSDNTAIIASPYNRIELAGDARNTEKGDSLGVYTEGQNLLKEKQQKISFEFSPQGVEAGNIYRQNWDVGDKITIAWDNDSVDVRITAVEISLAASGETISITTEVL